jgi:endonuclease YncB( thermonuclease family)
MKKKVLLVWFIVFFWLSPASAQTWTGKVLAVRDGDLLNIEHPEKGAVPLMLYGVDAPDRGQPFFEQAKEFLTDRVEGKVVTVREIPGKRKADTAIITDEGGNINEQVLAAGLGWVCLKNCDQEFCSDWKKLEARAREEKRGLWQDENPVPPCEWRQSVLTKIFRVFLWIIPPWSD